MSRMKSENELARIINATPRYIIRTQCEWPCYMVVDTQVPGEEVIAYCDNRGRAHDIARLLEAESKQKGWA